MTLAWNAMGLLIWLMIGISGIKIGWTLWQSVRTTRNQRGSVPRRPRWLFGVGLLWGLVVLGMLWVVWSGNRMAQNVTVTRSDKPIVLDTNGHQSYYVNIYKHTQPKANWEYTYLTKGEHYRVASKDSTIITGALKQALPAATYHSDEHKLQYLDRKYQKAWVETVTAHYRPNFLNGLGLRAGHQASKYLLIRIPDDSFIYYH